MPHIYLDISWNLLDHVKALIDFIPVLNDEFVELTTKTLQRNSWHCSLKIENRVTKFCQQILTNLEEL